MLNMYTDQILPRFYFDVQSDQLGNIQDREGSDLQDLVAARREAILLVVELTREVSRSQVGAHTIVVQVRDDQDVTAATVRLRLETSPAD